MSRTWLICLLLVGCSNYEPKRTLNRDEIRSDISICNSDSLMRSAECRNQYINSMKQQPNRKYWDVFTKNFFQCKDSDHLQFDRCITYTLDKYHL